MAEEGNALPWNLPESIILADLNGCYSPVPLPGIDGREEAATWDIPYQAAHLFYQHARDLELEGRDGAALAALETGLSLVEDGYFRMEVWRVYLIAKVYGTRAVALAAADFTLRNPSSNWALLLLGEQLESEDRWGEALKHYRRSTEIEPEDYWAFFARGRAAEVLELHEEAHAAFTRAIELDPEDSNAYCWRLHSSYNLSPGVEGLEAAAHDMGQALKRDEAYRKTYLDFLVGMGMVEGAVERLPDGSDGQGFATRSPHPGGAFENTPGSAAAPPSPSLGSWPRRTEGQQQTRRWSAPLNPDAVTDEMLVEGFKTWFKEGLPEPMM